METLLDSWSLSLVFSCALQSGQGHSEAFGVITRVHFPDVEFPRLAKARAPDNTEEALAATQASPAAAVSPTTSSTTAASEDGLVLRTSNGVGMEKEEAAAEAELLDTLVGLVALRGKKQNMYFQFQCHMMGRSEYQKKC